VDGPLALDQFVQARGDCSDIGRDCQAWWHRRKDGAGGAHTASALVALHKLIAVDLKFFPVRTAP
jgi:hypothetical protein